MSQATMDLVRTILSLFTAIITLCTPIVVFVLNKRQGKKIDVVEKKLDHNFEQANGHFTKLLETTAALSKEEGKKEQRENPKKGNL